MHVVKSAQEKEKTGLASSATTLVRLQNMRHRFSQLKFPEHTSGILVKEDRSISKTSLLLEYEEEEKQFYM